jgi:DNA adenine methylase
LFFDLEPPAGMLGDINPELVIALKSVQREPTLVWEAYRRLPKGKAPYYSLRKKNPADLPESERAARFLFLNRYCFNGLYRTNLKGEFNVPYAAPSSGRKSPRLREEMLLAASRILQRAALFNCDFEELLSRAKRGDLVYLDPPYFVAKRRVFSEYAPGSFGPNDLIRLRRCLETLCKRGVDFVISYADSSEARALFSDFRTTRMWTRRHIAGFASRRRGSYELLATNIKP